jgi:hypothetical protein
LPTYPLEQTSFTGGEISDLARGRVDLERYRASLKTARNTKIHVQGAISNRPGTLFGGPAHPAHVDPAGVSARAALVPFIVGEAEAYVLALTPYLAQVWTSGTDGIPVPLARAAADCPKVSSVISSGSDTVLELDADHDFLNGQDIFIQGATAGDWAAVNSAINGAYPRYTAELVEDATMGSVALDDFYAGNELTPPAFNFDSAPLSGVVALRDQVDVWLTGSAVAADATEWQQLIGLLGRLSPYPTRYTMNLYFKSSDNWSAELVFPGCSTPGNPSATAVDHISNWSIGDRKIFPVPILSTSTLASQAGSTSLVAHFINKRRIKLVGMNSTAFSSGSIVGASVHGVVTFATPYSMEQSREIQHAQSLDVLTCVHGDVPPHDISRYSTFEWLCQPKQLIHNTAPRNLLASTSATGDRYLYSYRVVGIDGFPSATSSGTGAYSEASQVDIGLSSPLDGNPTPVTTLTWESPGHKRFAFIHIFRLDRTTGTYKFHEEVAGDAVTTTDNAENLPTVVTGIRDQYTRDELQFKTAGNYPKTVNYNNQRIMLAGTDLEPERVWLSRVGDYTQFNVSDNIEDPSGAVQFDLAVSTRLSSIYSSVALQQLILLTDSGEISAGGGEGFASMTPLVGGVTLYPQSYYGASAGVMPALADDSAIYVQRKGGAIRDIRYKADGLAGAAFGSRELSVLSSHLLEGETVTSLAFADSPDSVVYAITSSGAMLAVSYSQEHGTVGFNRWDTGGITVENLSGVAQNDKFLAVAVIPEGEENGVYLSVLRYPPSENNQIHDPAGAMVFIERLVVNPTDRGIGFRNHVDCGMAYSVPIETNIIGVQVSSANGYEILQDTSPIALDKRVDIFEKSGLRASRNTSQDAYGQFAVKSNRTDSNGDQWSKLMSPSGADLDFLPALVDILDLEVRFPVAQIPASYITHGTKGTASPSASGSGWRPSQTYGLCANGMFYPDSDPALPLPAPLSWRGRAPVALTSSVFSSSVLDKTDPSFDYSGAFILFTKKAGSFIYGIFRMRVDGSDVTQITAPTTGTGDIRPVYSPDGTKIAFNRDGEVHIMDADGSNIVNISSGVDTDHPSWNPAGTKLAYQLVGGGHTTIYIADTSAPYAKVELVDSGAASIAPGSTNAKQPAWSHDGLTIAFTSNSGVSGQVIKGLAVNASTGVASGTPVLYNDSGAGFSNYHPSWSSGDDQVFYSSNRTAGTLSDIYARDIASGVTSGPEIIVVQGVSEEANPSASHVSGEPTKLVYEGDEAPYYNTEIMFRDGATFPGAASHFFFGEPFTAEVETNPLRGGKVPDAATTKRVAQVGFRVTDTHSIQISAGGDSVEWIAADEVTGHNGVLLYDGLGRVAVPAVSGREQTVKVTQPKPHPFTLSGLYPELEVEND